MQDDLGTRRVDAADMAAPDAAMLAEGYRSGRISPVEVVEAALERLARLEPALNAFILPMAEMARADAKRCEQEFRAGTDLGPLHGIPVAIKDLIDVAGVPTSYGTRAEPPRMATVDATLVARLRKAGAILFGKTNLLEYAYGIAHPDVGQTNNPHDLARTSGGSSGGSAAAVAAGIVPLAVGTDTGGSIRIPAAYCGIVGLKPSYGLVPLDGVFPLSQSLDHAGPLARNVTDAAHLLAAMTGQPLPLAPPALRDLRIGVLRAHFPREPVNLPVGDRVNEAIARLRAGGAHSREMTIEGIEAANGLLVIILKPEAALIHAKRLARNPQGYAPGTRAHIEAGFSVLATDYLAALQARTRIRHAVDAALQDVDVLISPSVPFVAPFEDPAISEDDRDGEMLASGLSNLTGHPTVSLPCGMVDGLPVGLQLTGRIGEEARLLSIARTIEAAI